MKSLIVLLAFAVLLASGCTPRPEETAPPPPPPKPAVPVLSLAEVGRVLAAGASDAERASVEKTMAQALGDPWDMVNGSGWHTLGLLSHPLGTVVIQRVELDAARLRLSLLGEDARVIWSKNRHLGKDWRCLAGAIVTEEGVGPLLRLELDGPQAEELPSRLFFALRTDGPLLAWAADGKGRWAADKIGVAHPQLALHPLSISTTDLVEQLAALVYLATPAGAEVRRDSKTQSILRELAGSVKSNWLAEAAARVSTMR